MFQMLFAQQGEKKSDLMFYYCNNNFGSLQKENKSKQMSMSWLYLVHSSQSGCNDHAVHFWNKIS